MISEEMKTPFFEVRVHFLRFLHFLHCQINTQGNENHVGGQTLTQGRSSLSESGGAHENSKTRGKYALTCENAQRHRSGK